MMADLSEAKEIPDLDLGEEAKSDCGAHWTSVLFASLNNIHIFHVLIFFCLYDFSAFKYLSSAHKQPASSVLTEVLYLYCRAALPQLRTGSVFPDTL